MGVPSWLDPPPPQTPEQQAAAQRARELEGEFELAARQQQAYTNGLLKEAKWFAIAAVVFFAATPFFRAPWPPILGIACGVTAFRKFLRYSFRR